MKKLCWKRSRKKPSSSFVSVTGRIGSHQQNRVPPAESSPISRIESHRQDRVTRLFSGFASKDTVSGFVIKKRIVYNNQEINLSTWKKCTERVQNFFFKSLQSAQHIVGQLSSLHIQIQIIFSRRKDIVQISKLIAEG